METGFYHALVSTEGNSLKEVKFFLGKSVTRVEAPNQKVRDGKTLRHFYDSSAAGRGPELRQPVSGTVGRATQRTATPHPRPVSKAKAVGLGQHQEMRSVTPRAWRARQRL